MRYKAKKKGDEDKISQSLQKLLMEDLTLNSVNDSENGQTVLYGIGDMQLEVVASELLEKYKVEIELMRCLLYTSKGCKRVHNSHGYEESASPDGGAWLW